MQDLKSNDETTLNALSTELSEQGFCILPSAVAPDTLDEMRQTVIDNRDRMANTRKSEHSRHLAGFERFDAFKNVFASLDQNADLNAFLSVHFGPQAYASFGLSDITVNRSQHWHTDLLRGRYGHYLDHVNPWGADVGSCIKALVYLQDGKSLRVAPASHLTQTPLDDDKLEELASNSDIHDIPVNCGDIVMMDIRCLHRGSTDIAMDSPALALHPKILISNVYAQKTSTLMQAMNAGNDHRLSDWDALHLRASA